MSTEYVTCKPDGEVKLRMGTEGLAAMTPVTVMDVLKKRVTATPNNPAMKKKVDGQWKSWTWAEYYEDVRKTAKAFMHFGLKPHQSVSIIGFNSPEWIFADLGAIFAGGMASGIYTTNGTEACRYIVEHSESVVVVVENETQLKKFLPIKSALTLVKAYVIYNGSVPEGAGSDVYTWEDFIKLGAEVPDSALEERMAAQRPGQCCTLIYTSGTTGNPKAVMISHDNVTFTSESTLDHFRRQNPHLFEHQQHIISFLPLSHIAAQMMDIHFPMVLGATLWFAQPDALKGSLIHTLKEVRPTLFFGVPRVWEKFGEKLEETMGQAKGIKRRLSNWASEVSLQEYRAVQGEGHKPASGFLAKKLVLDKVRHALGFDRCVIMLTGAAPISKETLETWGAWGMHVLELYGMSESTGPQTISALKNFKAGSCGVCLPGTELRLDNPDAGGNGEIIYTGRHIMMGYMKAPEATAETIDSEGFLHSGDVGKMEDGMLYITGRLKELLITAGGENVAPVPIEDRIKAEAPALSNVMVIGDRMKFLSAVVTLKADPLPDGTSSENLAGPAKAVDPEATTVAQAMKSAVWQKYIEDAIIRYNKGAMSNAQKVQKFKILPADFSEVGRELTPTMKIKRKVVIEKYAKVIEEMYAGSQE